MYVRCIQEGTTKAVFYITEGVGGACDEGHQWMKVGRDGSAWTREGMPKITQNDRTGFLAFSTAA